MTRRLLVDDTRCIGAGHCARLAPDVFDQDQERGTVLLVVSDVDAGEGAIDAVSLCPSGAIRWTPRSS